MRNAIVLTLAEDTSEIKSLLSTLDIQVIREYSQKRSQPHTTSYLGPGKIDDIYNGVDEKDFDLVVVNGILKPSQHHYLEMKFQIECIDRFGVILRIFTEHAHTPEAMAQVQLAKFRYELPFLREWIHKAKKGDRPGFLSGGAYATDVYYEYARKQVNRIEKHLSKISKEREIMRAKRRAKGYTLVCLSGYTNAGKSSLLNAMCHSLAEVDNRMFSTLSTTTRRLPGIKNAVLVTDTVGFIRDLPPDLMNAFKSTIEEIFYADIILVIFDTSNVLSDIVSKLSVSLNILVPRIENHSLIVVGNKVDLLQKGEVQTLISAIRDITDSYPIVFVSATTGEGVNELKECISDLVCLCCRISAKLTLTSGSYSVISDLHSKAQIASQVHEGKLAVEIMCRQEDKDLIVARLHPFAIGRIDVEDTSSLMR